MANRILAVFAHPDDETFSAGGVLAQHVLSGDQVRVVILSDGVGSRFSTTSNPLMIEAFAQRLEAFEAACTILGVHETYIPQVFPDQRSDTVPQLIINRAVEAEFSAMDPTIVYTHFAGDLNLDHRRTAEAVLVAARMGPPVYCAEPEFPARCVGLRWLKSETCRINIEPTLQTKLQACAAYAMELRQPPHPRSLAQFEQRRSECFVVIR